MQMAKASDEAKALFRSVVPEAPGVVVKPMFGNLGAFVNGNMFAGLFGATVGVRLADDAPAGRERRLRPPTPRARPSPRCARRCR